MSWASLFISANELAAHGKTGEHSAVLNFNMGENCTFIRDEKKKKKKKKKKNLVGINICLPEISLHILQGRRDSLVNKSR